MSSFPRMGLPAMTAESAQQRRGQIFFSSPYAPGAYLIKGATVRNDLGGTVNGMLIAAGFGFPEGLLVSKVVEAAVGDVGVGITVPWQTGDDDTGSEPGAYGVLATGYGEDLADNENVLLTVVTKAAGGIRVGDTNQPSMYYNSGTTVIVIATVTQAGQFAADYIVAANQASQGGSSQVSTETDPDSNATTGGPVLFYS